LSLYEQYKEQGLTVVAINLEPQANKAELSQFRELADKAAYTWAFDTTFAVAQAYSVQTLDATVIIDGSGLIAYQDTMPTPLDTLEAELQKWLPAAGG
jgi:alkyl hydroperoxide reductase subunit AhpC